MFDYAELFARNYLLFTSAQMEKLREARCLSLGIGAIGGVATILMARAGVEHFMLLDSDSFEPHNSNRQLCCLTNTIGRPKAEVIAARLQQINPRIEVEPLVARIERKLLKKLLPRTDVVLLSADESLPKTLLLLDRAPAPIVWGFCCGSLGVLSSFAPPNKSCSIMEFQGVEFPWHGRRFWSEFRTEAGFTDEWWEDMQRGKVVPATWNVTTWVTGSLMAGEAIKLITGKWEPIFAPQFWFIRPTSISLQTVNLKKGVIRTLTEMGSKKGAERNS